MPISLQSFRDDPHAAAYVPALESHPDATRRLLELLNEPINEERLIDAERLHDRPALTGVVRLLEDDPEIVAVLASGPASYRFRQAVGVGVRLKMEERGWATTGRKGTVPKARYFTKSERYSAA